jgi:hypothetical protein
MSKLKNVLWAAALALVASACSRSSGGAHLSISGSTKPVASTASTTPSTPITSTSLDLGNGITLDRVRIVVRELKVELDPTGASSTTTATNVPLASNNTTKVEGEPGDPSEPTFGPILIDLKGTAIAGGIEQAVTGLVPEGSFHEAKIAIGPLTTAQAGTDQGLGEMVAQNASVIIDGKVDGTPFAFVSSLVAEIDVESEFVVNDTKSNNITVDVDPRGWFGGSGASRLDPLPANQTAIESLIKAAIIAFEDDDLSGQEDSKTK